MNHRVFSLIGGRTKEGPSSIRTVLPRGTFLRHLHPTQIGAEDFQRARGIAIPLVADKVESQPKKKERKKKKRVFFPIFTDYLSYLSWERAGWFEGASQGREQSTTGR